MEKIHHLTHENDVSMNMNDMNMHDIVRVEFWKSIALNTPRTITNASDLVEQCKTNRKQIWTQLATNNNPLSARSESQNLIKKIDDFKLRAYKYKLLQSIDSQVKKINHSVDHFEDDEHDPVAEHWCLSQELFSESSTDEILPSHNNSAANTAAPVFNQNDNDIFNEVDRRIQALLILETERANEMRLQLKVLQEYRQDSECLLQSISMERGVSLNI
jgi:hypothetical protein